MTIMPVQVPVSAAWTELQRQTQVLVSPPAANGVCSVAFPQIPVDQYWLIEHIVVQNTSTAHTQARVYLDSPTQTQDLLDGTYVGNMDVADYASPLLVPTARALVIQWSGCNPGDIGTAYLQYRLFQNKAAY